MVTERASVPGSCGGQSGSSDRISFKLQQRVELGYLASEASADLFAQLDKAVVIRSTNASGRGEGSAMSTTATTTVTTKQL